MPFLILLPVVTPVPGIREIQGLASYDFSCISLRADDDDDDDDLGDVFPCYRPFPWDDGYGNDGEVVHSHFPFSCDGGDVLYCHSPLSCGDGDVLHCHFPSSCDDEYGDDGGGGDDVDPSHRPFPCDDEHGGFPSVS